MKGGGCKMSKDGDNIQYKKLHYLGHGSFGFVYLVENCNGDKYAMKQIEILEKQSYLIESEINYMKMLDNQFIAKFYGSLPITKIRPSIRDMPNYKEFLSKLEKYNIKQQIKIMERKIDTLGQLFTYNIILEYCEGGDLSEYKITHKLNENSIKIIMYQLLSGVKYLHDAGIIHRDLKPENILLKYKDNLDCLKITDFGLSTKYNKNCCYGIHGTSNYMAPEIFTSNEIAKDTNHKYSNKCDLWSIGVIFYVLCCGFYPFDNTTLVYKLANKSIAKKDRYVRTHFNLTSNILNFIPKKISTEAKDLLESLLEFDSSQRWDCQTCLDCQWFEGYDTSIHDRCLTV